MCVVAGQVLGGLQAYMLLLQFVSRVHPSPCLATNRLCSLPTKTPMLVAPHWKPCPTTQPIPHNPHIRPPASRPALPGRAQGTAVPVDGQQQARRLCAAEHAGPGGGLDQQQARGVAVAVCGVRHVHHHQQGMCEARRDSAARSFSAWATAAVFYSCRFRKGGRRQAVCMGQLPQHGGSCCNLQKTHESGCRTAGAKQPITGRSLGPWQHVHWGVGES